MFLHQTATHFSRAANENTISHSLLSLSPHTWPLEGSTVVVSSGRSTSPADSAPGSILKQPSPSLAERGVRAFLGEAHTLLNRLVPITQLAALGRLVFTDGCVPFFSRALLSWPMDCPTAY